MVTLITATGREIPCEAVIRATAYTFLTIHTHALTRIEIDTIFDNPEETIELTAVETVEAPDENGETVEIVTTKVYRRFTVLDAVQLSPFYSGDLMIWLTRPEEDE